MTIIIILSLLLLFAIVAISAVLLREKGKDFSITIREKEKVRPVEKVESGTPQKGFFSSLFGSLWSIVSFLLKIAFFAALIWLGFYLYGNWQESHVQSETAQLCEESPECSVYTLQVSADKWTDQIIHGQDGTTVKFTSYAPVPVLYEVVDFSGKVWVSCELIVGEEFVDPCDDSSVKTSPITLRLRLKEGQGTYRVEVYNYKK